MRVDSHHHFWRYNDTEYTWIGEDKRRLKQDFLPGDLKPLLDATGYDATVVVQARQTEAETGDLLNLADVNDFVKGVVGWVDLRAEDVDERLARWRGRAKLKGVRHAVHDEPDDRFMLRPEFRRGLGRLAPLGLTYDLLTFPRHLPVAIEIAREFPEQPFVLDHISKPAIAEGRLAPWDRDIAELARFENVYCKLSGMVTEAVWGDWRATDFHRYLDIVIEAFGAGRLMIGSDWPVCTLSGDYAAVMSIVAGWAKALSADEQAGILGDNCVRFYSLT